MGRRSTEAPLASLVSPETGLPIGPQFDRGGRFGGDLESLPPPDRSKTHGAGSPAGEISMLYRRAFISLLFGFTACGPVLGQTNDQPPDEVDTNVVIAPRSPLAKPNIGCSAAVITHDQIERRQVRYVTDLLRAVPGFSVSHTDSARSNGYAPRN